MDETTVAVRSRESVGPDAVALVLATPDGFEARPGQFVRVGLPVGGESESRFYTISSPDADGEVEITVDAGPESGAVAGALAGLEPGATVTIAGPFGDQYYDDEPRPVLLAGGPGVGPAVAIAGRALAAGNEAVVVYRDDAPIHRDRLDALRDRGVSVTVLDADASLTDAVADALERDGQVFVYGFEGFVDDALDAVVAAGDDPDAATVENFG